MHKKSLSSPLSPFPPHVRDYLFPTPHPLVDHNGVSIQPLSQSPGLESVIREIETQMRKSYIRKVKAADFQLDEEKKPDSLPQQPKIDVRTSSKLKKMMQELAALRLQYSPPSDRDDPDADLGNLLSPPLIPSQRLLSYLHSPVTGQKTARKPTRVLRPQPALFPIPRKAEGRGCVLTTRSPSPVLMCPRLQRVGIRAEGGRRLRRRAESTVASPVIRSRNASPTVVLPTERGV